MPRTLKLVFHVEDEDKNLVMEKSQMVLTLDDETLEKADLLPSMDVYPLNLDELREWQRIYKPYQAILDVIDASFIVTARECRKAIINWAKQQRTPANAG